MKDELFQCTYCNKEYTNIDLLQSHEDIHMSPYSCKMCDKGFLSEKCLKNHIAKHNVKVCLEKLVLPEELLDGNSYLDVKCEIDPRVIHNCDICNKEFTNSKDLRRHLYDTHRDPQQCEVCSKTYSSRRIHKHLRGVHNIIRCSRCQEQFKDLKDLKQHVAKHHSRNLEKQQCGKCLKMLSIDSIRRHDCSSRVFKSCKTCQNEFLTFEDLQMHRLTHEGAEQCDSPPANMI